MTIFHYLKYGDLDRFEKNEIPESIYKDMLYWYYNIGLPIYSKYGAERYWEARHKKLKEILFAYEGEE